MRGPRHAVGMLTVVLVTGAGTVACGGGGDHDEPAPSVRASIIVRSPDLHAGAAIPRRFTCDGSGDAPRLQWTAVPKSTKALAVLVDDGDAPSGPYVHWLVLDLPATATSLDRTVASTAHQATNSAGRIGWTPPCPPSGDHVHHYRFTVYALRRPTGLPVGVDDPRAKQAIDDLAISRGQFVATYQRHG